MKNVLIGVGVLVVLVVAFLGYQYWKLQQAAVQWTNAKEIYSESIENDGAKWKVAMKSLIDKPLDKVWRALQQPERSAEFLPAFKKSELIKSEPDKKVVQFQIQVLTLPLQTLTAQLDFDQGNHTMKVKTLESQTQDLQATYSLQASPDGQRTLLSYDAVATNKISVPLPQSVQKGAVRELFVNQVRAIMKGIEDEEKKAKAAA